MWYTQNLLCRSKLPSTLGNGTRSQKLQVIPSKPLEMQKVTKIFKNALLDVNASAVLQVDE